MTYRAIAVAIALAAVACATGKVCDRGMMERYGWPLAWSAKSLPLTIGPDGHGNDRHLDALLDAARELNYATGLALFSPDASRGDIAVFSSASIPVGSTLAGETELEFVSGGELFRASVSLRDDLRDTALHDVALHELGHVLGLEHDSCPGSIMTTPMVQGEHYGLLDSDVGRLRATYGGAP